MNSRRPRVLVLSRNYPNNITPLLGLWTEGLIRHVAERCDVRVIAPVPYCPPLLGLSQYTRFRDVARRERSNGVEVLHPRFLTGPGFSLHRFEAPTYGWAVRRPVEQLRREFPFDLIHAFFGFPDGVVAAQLSEFYQVPLLISEPAPWQPALYDQPRVRNQALRAAQRCSFHIAPSRYARSTIARYTGESEKLRILPNGVDTSSFTLLGDSQQPIPNQILYVGIMRHVKGIDVLLHAMRRLIDRRPDARLILVGGGFYQNYSLVEKQLRALAVELGLQRHVEFVGMKSPSEVAAHMRESALLVVPSRSETFGSVVVEALACGTPVVSTRCGGPEEIINETVGVLVPKENPAALAAGIEKVMEQRQHYDSKQLRQYAVEHFAWERIAEQTLGLYNEALERFRAGKGRAC